MITVTQAKAPRRNQRGALDGEHNQCGREQGHGQKQGVVAPTGNCRKHVKISSISLPRQVRTKRRYVLEYGGASWHFQLQKERTSSQNAHFLPGKHE
jgi:hypothetical protein